MEFKVEIKDEYNQKGIESQLQLSTSTDLEHLKNKLDNSEMALKAKIKEEFPEGGQGYIESQLFTSPDLEDLINKPDEDNSVYMSTMEFKVEIKDEYNQKGIESQLKLSTSTDLEHLKNKLDNSETALKAKIKEEFPEGGQGYIESQLFTSPDLEDLINKPDEDNSGERCDKSM
ncbi:unnamed protein product [Diabrotica balteata]|uniref:Uncharacterized protein n=1 Tax=Diabrotica balteata TaxID=107213 RepID=A0A9N9X9E8_DIABA|nr:unnamed protein product [Diabrotica balteata]